MYVNASFVLLIFDNGESKDRTFQSQCCQLILDFSMIHIFISVASYLRYFILDVLHTFGINLCSHNNLRAQCLVSRKF